MRCLPEPASTGIRGISRTTRSKCARATGAPERRVSPTPQRMVDRDTLVVTTSGRSVALQSRASDVQYSESSERLSGTPCQPQVESGPTLNWD